jgi:hypothetical protein
VAADGSQQLASSSSANSYTFTGLPQGATTLRVCAVDSAGARTCQGSSVVVAPPGPNYKPTDTLGSLDVGQMSGTGDATVLGAGVFTLSSVAAFTKGNAGGSNDSVESPAPSASPAPGTPGSGGAPGGYGGSLSRLLLADLAHLDEEEVIEEAPGARQLLQLTSSPDDEVQAALTAKCQALIAALQDASSKMTSDLQGMQQVGVSGGAGQLPAVYVVFAIRQQPPLSKRPPCVAAAPMVAHLLYRCVVPHASVHPRLPSIS